MAGLQPLSTRAFGPRLRRLTALTALATRPLIATKRSTARCGQSVCKCHAEKFRSANFTRILTAVHTRIGEITAPCGMPRALRVTRPSSVMPTFSHFAIRRRMRLSAIRCSRKRIIHEWALDAAGTCHAVMPPPNPIRHQNPIGQPGPHCQTEFQPANTKYPVRRDFVTDRLAIKSVQFRGDPRSDERAISAPQRFAIRAPFPAL